jgi:hypothetical protein
LLSTDENAKKKTTAVINTVVHEPRPAEIADSVRPAPAIEPVRAGS